MLKKLLKTIVHLAFVVGSLLVAYYIITIYILTNL